METEPHISPAFDDGEGSESLKQGHNPLVAVIGAIVIALVMASVGYFGFKRPPRNYHGTAIVSHDDSSSTTPPSSSAVTDTDIQKAVDTVDKSFDQLDDNKDFNPADLSDSTLGL